MVEDARPLPMFRVPTVHIKKQTTAVTVLTRLIWPAMPPTHQAVPSGVICMAMGSLGRSPSGRSGKAGVTLLSLKVAARGGKRKVGGWSVERRLG